MGSSAVISGGTAHDRHRFGDRRRPRRVRLRQPGPDGRAHPARRVRAAAPDRCALVERATARPHRVRRRRLLGDQQARAHQGDLPRPRAVVVQRPRRRDQVQRDVQPRGAGRPAENLLLHMDPPQHAKLRKIVSRGFTRASSTACTTRCRTARSGSSPRRSARRRGRLRHRGRGRAAAAGDRRADGRPAGGPAAAVRLVQQDARLRRPRVQRRPGLRRRRDHRLLDGAGRAAPRLPRARHRDQARPGRRGRARPVRRRVRLLHDPSGRRSTRRPATRSPTG